MPLVLNGTTGVQDNSGAFVAGTAITSTSGTSIDFTSIPSWVKRITVMLNDISVNSTSAWLIQIGTSGGVTTSGYQSQYWSGGASFARSTAGFIIADNNASFGWDGVITISKVTGNSWIESGVINITSTNNVGSQSVGRVTLGAALDRVRITTVGGTATFDAGTINILYE